MIFSQQCKVNGFRTWRLVQSLTSPEAPFITDDTGKILEFDSEQEADSYISKGQKLIENSIPASEDCTWCDAKLGECHSPACQNGERYKQVQQILGSGKEIFSTVKYSRNTKVSKIVVVLD